jgi:hypothetical protein
MMHETVIEVVKAIPLIVLISFLFKSAHKTLFSYPYKYKKSMIQTLIYILLMGIYSVVAY